MRRSVHGYTLLSSLLLSIVLLGSCTEPETHELFDPGASDRPTPTINSISPSGSAIAGMDSIVISGLYFSAVAEENTIYLNKTLSTVLDASTTQLVTIAPSEAVDTSVDVRVSVRGALQFSNGLSYTLLAGVESFGDLAPETNLIPAELVSSMTIAPNGDLCMAFIFGASDGGVLTFTPSGVRTTYAPATSGVLSWTGLKYGTGGYLYAARNFRALYRFPPGGGTTGALWAIFPSGVRIFDMDFDQSGMLWCGGDNGDIYRVASDKSMTTFPFTGNISSVRIFGSDLYMLADTGDGMKVWRAAISAGNLGVPEVFFDFPSVFPGKTPMSVTFSTDGVLVIGTEPPEGLIFVRSDKSWSAPYTAYKDFFGTGVDVMAWEGNNILYAGTVEGSLIRFTIRGATGAPYHGNTQ